MRLNVDFDLTLTVLADLLYRKLAGRLKGFSRTAHPSYFGSLSIRQATSKSPRSRDRSPDQPAHNPVLKEAGLTEPTRPVPWLGGRSVKLVCP